MTGRWSRILSVALAVFTVSCAEPPREEPVSQPAAPVVKKESPAAPTQERGRMTSISMEELFLLHQNDKVFLLDARPSFFYSVGHIQGAISMPKGGSAAHIRMREEEIKTVLAAGKTIVLYCTNAACPDARSVAANLSAAGYPSSVLVGGYEAWKESGLPVE